MSSVHVTVDVRMRDHAGIGTYIRNVVPRVAASRPEWRFTLLEAAASARGDVCAPAPNVDVVRMSSPIYSIAEQGELRRRIPRDATLMWSPHYNIPVLSSAPLVVTVHDVGHLALRDTHGSPLQQFYARQMFGAVRRRARAVIFDSKFTEREFASRVGAPRRGVTIALAADERWTAPAPAEASHARPFFLFVGSVKPHKNLLSLLRAFERVTGSVAEDLVIVGATDGQRTTDDAAVDFAKRLGDRVRFLGRVDDDVLRTHMAHATALVLPSLYEGFGLPALEAMAAGCPCVVSSAASLPEVCGDAAEYFDPRNVDDIARQLVRVASDDALRTRLSHAGRRRAAEFSWERTATESTAVLERAMTTDAG